MKAIQKDGKFILIEEDAPEINSDLIEQITQAINKIEEFLGLQKTDFRRNN